ncbi:MAG: hypothetical protein E7598_02750 [Ruminococcaceae bacterium]|nr:hypothetical protein [Oscillospiraceae bacterium]
MKKYMALLLAVLMICMFGCTAKDNGNDNAETTEAPVLLTAEEYFLKAFEADLEKSMNLANSYKTANMSVGIENIDYLLSLFAMSPLPVKISDAVLEISGDTDNMSAVYGLSANINDRDAALAVGLDMKTFDMTVFSNLFEEVIGINYAEVVGVQMPDMSTLYSFSYDSVKEYTMRIGELLAECNSSLDLTDNGDTVTVTIDMDAEDIYNFTKALVDELAADEQFVKLMKEVYQIDIEADVKAGLDDEATKNELLESGIALVFNVDIDKTTFDTYVAEVEFSNTEGKAVLTAEQMDGAATITLDVNGEIAFELSYVSAPDTFASDFSFVSEEVNCGGHISADDGVFDASLYVITSEYDWDAGKEAEVEQTFSANGTYTAADNKWTVALDEVAYNDISISLSEAGVTLGYELGCEVPVIPGVTKNFTDITDEEGQALVMGVFEKLGINPAMFGIGAADTVPEVEF